MPENGKLEIECFNIPTEVNHVHNYFSDTDQYVTLTSLNISRFDSLRSEITSHDDVRCDFSVYSMAC